MSLRNVLLRWLYPAAAATEDRVRQLQSLYEEQERHITDLASNISENILGAQGLQGILNAAHRRADSMQMTLEGVADNLAEARTRLDKQGTSLDDLRTRYASLETQLQGLAKDLQGMRESAQIRYDPLTGASPSHVAQYCNAINDENERRIAQYFLQKLFELGQTAWEEQKKVIDSNDYTYSSEAHIPETSTRLCLSISQRMKLCGRLHTRPFGSSPNQVVDDDMFHRVAYGDGSDSMDLCISLNYNHPMAPRMSKHLLEFGRTYHLGLLFRHLEKEAYDAATAVATARGFVDEPQLASYVAEHAESNWRVSLWYEKLQKQAGARTPPL